MGIAERHASTVATKDQDAEEHHSLDLVYVNDHLRFPVCGDLTSPLS